MDATHEPEADARTPSADQAATRLRDELAKGLLSDPERARSLEVVDAHRAVRGSFQMETAIAHRRVVDVEEPALYVPKKQDILQVWAPMWPPSPAVPLSAQTIDLRDCSELLACPACGHVGEVQCAACRGSGTVHDPKKKGMTRTCPKCHGKGTVACRRCAGHGRLLRFKRIFQEVKRSSTHLRYPDGEQRQPHGHESGRLFIDQELGFGDDAAALKAIIVAAPQLAADWLPALAQSLAATPEACSSPDNRLGWRKLSGGWHCGWELRCRSGDKTLNYFVPDTQAPAIGPQIRSTRKLRVAGVATVSIVGAVILMLFLLGNMVAKSRQAELQNQAATATAAAARRAAAASATAEAKDLLATQEAVESLQRVQEAAVAIEADRENVSNEVAALESAVQAGKWDEAASAADAIEARLAPALVIDSPIREATWVVELQTRLKQQQDLIQAENDRQEAAAEATRSHNRAVAEATQSKKAAEAAALHDLCGDEPLQSAWDGMVAPAKRWIKDHMNDPDSFEAIGCTEPTLSPETCWVTVCQFRGNNAFGGKIVNEFTFSIGANGAILAAVQTDN